MTVTFHLFGHHRYLGIGIGVKVKACKQCAVHVSKLETHRMLFNPGKLQRNDHYHILLLDRFRFSEQHVLPYNRVVLGKEEGREMKHARRGEMDTLGVASTNATIQGGHSARTWRAEVRTLRNASLCWIFRGFLRVV